MLRNEDMSHADILRGTMIGGRLPSHLVGFSIAERSAIEHHDSSMLVIFRVTYPTDTCDWN